MELVKISIAGYKIGSFIAEYSRKSNTGSYPVPHISCTTLILCHTYPVPHLSCATLTLCHTYPVPHLSCATLTLCHTYPVPHLSCATLILCHTYPVPHILCHTYPVLHLSCATLTLCHTYPVPHLPCSQSHSLNFNFNIVFLKHVAVTSSLFLLSKLRLEFDVQLTVHRDKFL